MGYLEREKALIGAMEKDNYALFDGDRDEALDTIANALESFPNYANSVIHMQVMMPLWQARCEGQEFRDRVQDADQSRRAAHEGAIASLSMLNRICVKQGLEPFAQVDTKDRYAVADFVGQYVSEVYASGQHRSMDDLVKNQDRPFRSADIESRLRRLSEIAEKDSGEESTYSM